MYVCICIFVLCQQCFKQSSQNLFNFLNNNGDRSISCSNIWVFTPVPDTELDVPWNFLGNRSIFCSNEATHGGPLNGFRTSAGHQKDQRMIIGLKTSAPPHHLWRVKGLEIELFTRPMIYTINETSKKTHNRVQRASGLGNTSRCRVSDMPKEDT